jgi:hypothetical protein
MKGLSRMLVAGTAQMVVALSPKQRNRGRNLELTGAAA